VAKRSNTDGQNSAGGASELRLVVGAGLRVLLTEAERLAFAAHCRVMVDLPTEHAAAKAP
jgi:putative component of toxin-antitoxin plasmid stabilization module